MQALLEIVYKQFGMTSLDEWMLNTPRKSPQPSPSTNEQIPLMVHIYSSASRVLAWLGGDETDVDLKVPCLGGVSPVSSAPSFNLAALYRHVLPFNSGHIHSFPIKAATKSDWSNDLEKRQVPHSFLQS